MSKFTRETHTVDGVKTVGYTAGQRRAAWCSSTAPARSTASISPSRGPINSGSSCRYHPGFGESGDDPTFTDLHDYVMHYLELFDVLRLDTFNLVGLSLGGYHRRQDSPASTAIGSRSSR